MSDLCSDSSWVWPRYLDGWQGRRTPPETAIGKWRWPWVRSLAAAAFIEWRYFAILAPAFHGIVGMSLVNPERRFGGFAEGGLLVIVAGVLEQGTEANETATVLQAITASGESDSGESDSGESERQELCWMHLFGAEACRFDDPSPGALHAADQQCALTLELSEPGTASLRLETTRGLRLTLEHRGLSASAVTPVVCRELDAPMPALLGSHWQVDCAAPIARCDGEIDFGPEAFAELATGPGGNSDSYATPALRAAVHKGARRFRWSAANGYAEHSFGVRPLLLHGWDFLFVPKWASGEAVVMQTYRGSRRLCYLEVFWREEGIARYRRFERDSFRLAWVERTFDPVLGVWRPRRRLIEAEAEGLRLRIDNRVLHRVPLLRRHKLAVRHFFISEEIGIADWRLEDAGGRCLAAVTGQPCGGELAHFRWRAPLREA